MIADMVVPPDSDLIVIDRGILNLRFEWREGKWEIAESEELFADRYEVRCLTAA